MRRLRRKIARLKELTPQQRTLLIEAAALLVGSRLALLVVPFRKLAARLRTARGAPPRGDASARLVEDVGWAVHAAGRHLPWANTCLTRAMTAKRVLGRRGVASTLHLGVARDADHRLEAHAWLTVGGRTLTGGEIQERFTPVSTFSDERA